MTQFCLEDIDQWQESFNQTLVDAGRLRNPATGTCPVAANALEQLTMQFEQSGKACIDNEAAFRQANLPPILDSCATAATLGLCTVEEQSAQAAIISVCPASCGVCQTVPCVDNDAFFTEVVSAGGNAQGITSCSDAFTAGLCSSANLAVRGAVRNNCPLSCSVCDGTCKDLNAALAFEETLPSGATNIFSNCQDAASAGLCANTGAADNLFVRNVCKATCATCPAPSGRRQRRELQTSATAEIVQFIGSFESASEIVSLDGCVDPLVVTTVGALEVALSDEVIIGALALRRSSTVLLTLLPAALGLGLGAGQGMTVTKSLFPSSRVPSRLAGVIVSVSIPTLAALLGFINQLLASPWGTLACACLIAALSVWMPLGLFGTIYRGLRLIKKAVKGAELKLTRSQGTGDRLTDAILYPAKQPVIVTAISRRKNMLSLYLLISVVSISCFFGISSASSMVTEQFDEFVTAVSAAASDARSGDFSDLGYFVMTVVSTLARLTAISYLAQAFFVDMGVMLITSIWHHDFMDEAEIKEKRERELSEAAVALGFGSGDEASTKGNMSSGPEKSSV